MPTLLPLAELEEYAGLRVVAENTRVDEINASREKRRTRATQGGPKSVFNFRMLRYFPQKLETAHSLKIQAGSQRSLNVAFVLSYDLIQFLPDGFEDYC